MSRLLMYKLACYAKKYGETLYNKIFCWSVNFFIMLNSLIEPIFSEDVFVLVTKAGKYTFKVNNSNIDWCAGCVQSSQ